MPNNRLACVCILIHLLGGKRSIEGFGNRDMYTGTGGILDRSQCFLIYVTFTVAAGPNKKNRKHNSITTDGSKYRVWSPKVNRVWISMYTVQYIILLLRQNLGLILLMTL